MKKNVYLTFLTSFVLMVATSFDTRAQEGPAPSAGLGKLIGEIRWKKTMGVTPEVRFGLKPRQEICSPFHVVVVDPDQNDKIVWFANLLTPGRSDDEYYRCRYEILLPRLKPLKARADNAGRKGIARGTVTGSAWHEKNMSGIGDVDHFVVEIAWHNGVGVYKGNTPFNKSYLRGKTWPKEKPSGSVGWYTTQTFPRRR